MKDTFNFDVLNPIFIDEILPGDTANLNLSTFARLATQLVPIMDNLYIDFFFFFVPNRLVWDNWEKFCGSQDNPGDSTNYIIPQLDPFLTNQPAVDSIYDKFGLPTWTNDASGSVGYGGVNALPLRGYNLIFNEWFRDQNLQNSLTVNTDDGPDPLTYALVNRNKLRDYFTGCLPWPQKGAAVTLPLGTSAPILRVPDAAGWGVFNAGTNTPTATAAVTVNGSGGLATAAGGVSLDPEGGLFTDLSSATAATINSLRQAIQVQGLLELDARGGTRYVEILLAHFNVTSPDFRLQRPEYLGGGRQKIAAHPVAQTAPTSGSDYQGNLASFATSAGNSIGFTKSFVEHGYVIGLASARADITYQNGLNKLWSRSTRYDFFWPKLQELGEQAVLNQEIWMDFASSNNNGGVFGYQERYAEYRYKPSEIHGQFRSTYSTPIDFWHMAEDFATLPALNSTFIQNNTPILRALANTDPTVPQILMDCWYQYKHVRPMMTYSVPVTLGRF